MLRLHARRRMKLLRVLIPHVLLPMWFITLMVTVAQQDSSTWLAVLIAAAAHIGYISVAGSWSWFGTYLQRGLPLIVVAAAFITRPRFLAINDSPQAAELRLLSFGLAILFVVLMLMAFVGRRARGPFLDLEFPLHDGTFMIAQGGTSRVVNRHAGNASQRYGVDIVRIGPFGVRAKGLHPVPLKKYEIYGQQVFSPCEGVVVAVQDDLPDMIPSESDPNHPAGNHVVIESQGFTVYLMHLMKGSVAVEPGRRVRVGQILGRVGNSGKTTEPHLHVHAEKGTYTGKFSGQPGMPIRFGGRFLVRNDSVIAPE